MKIAANELADAVMSELAAYSEEALNRLEESFKKIAAEAAKRLRQSSPKRTGGYAKSWTKNVTRSEHGVTARAYNRKFYNLTYLLELGHAKAGGGRVAGTPHIEPVQEWAGDKALAASAAAFEKEG